MGSTEPDHWAGTSVKINASHLEAASGLRVAIIPSFAGRSDAIRLDAQKNLIASAAVEVACEQGKPHRRGTATPTTRSGSPAAEQVPRRAGHRALPGPVPAGR